MKFLLQLAAVFTLCLTANAQQSDLAPGTIPLTKITPETGKGGLWEMATTGINKDLKRSALGLWCGGRMNSRSAYSTLPELSKKKDRFNETILYYAATQKNRVAEHAADVNYEEREQVRLAAAGLSLWAQMFYLNAESDGSDPLQDFMEVPPAMYKSTIPDVAAAAITAAAYTRIPNLWDTHIKEAPDHIAGVRGAKLLYKAMMDMPLEVEEIVAVLEAPERNHITEMGPKLAGPHPILPDAANACFAIAKTDFTEAKKALVKWVSHEDLRVQIEAARGLVKMGGDECVIPFATIVKDCPWPLLMPVTDGLAANPDKRVIPLLIQRLQKEDGRMRKHVLHALGSIAGELHGTNSTEWISWYRDSFEDFEVDAARSEAWRSANHPDKIILPKNTEFFGLPIHSSRFVYLLDSTELMKKGRIYAAREKTFHSLKDLRKGAKYGLIEFQDDIKFINTRTLTEDNRAGAFHILDMEQAGTNRRSWDAIYKALLYPEVDTLYYVSAGPPLKSSLPYWQDMRYALITLTKYRPVHIHVIDLAPVAATRRDYESLTRQFGGTYTTFDVGEAGDDPRFFKEGD